MTVRDIVDIQYRRPIYNAYWLNVQLYTADYKQQHSDDCNMLSGIAYMQTCQMMNKSRHIIHRCLISLNFKMEAACGLQNLLWLVCGLFTSVMAL